MIYRIVSVYLVFLLVIIALFVIFVLSGCTTVDADINTGKISVWTFMTSRQDVTIEHLADGTVRWQTSRSDADSSLAKAVLNMSQLAVEAAKVP